MLKYEYEKSGIFALCFMDFLILSDSVLVNNSTYGCSLKVSDKMLFSFFFSEEMDQPDKTDGLMDKFVYKRSSRGRRDVEERKRKKRERRERENKRISPHNWDEFNKAGFNVYRFRREKSIQAKACDHKYEHRPKLVLFILL